MKALGATAFSPLLLSISDISASPPCLLHCCRSTSIRRVRPCSLTASDGTLRLFWIHFFSPSLSLSLSAQCCIRVSPLRGWHVGTERVFVCRRRCCGTEAPLKVQTRLPRSPPLSLTPIKTSISHHTESNKNEACTCTDEPKQNVFCEATCFQKVNDSLVK